MLNVFSIAAIKRRDNPASRAAVFLPSLCKLMLKGIFQIFVLLPFILLCFLHIIWAFFRLVVPPLEWGATWSISTSSHVSFFLHPRNEQTLSFTPCHNICFCSSVNARLKSFPLKPFRINFSIIFTLSLRFLAESVPYETVSYETVSLYLLETLESRIIFPFRIALV